MSEVLVKAVNDLYNRAMDTISRLYVRCGFSSELREGAEITVMASRAVLLSAMEYAPVDVPDYMYSYLQSIRSVVLRLLNECIEMERAEEKEIKEFLGLLEEYMKLFHELLPEKKKEKKKSKGTRKGGGSQGGEEEEEEEEEVEEELMFGEEEELE